MVFFFPLPPGVTERVRRVRVHRIVLDTRYVPVRALAAVLCACVFNWTRPDVAG